MILRSNKIEQRKNFRLYAITGLVLFLFGAFMAVDSVNYFYKTGIKAVGFIKLAVSLICSISVWIAGNRKISSRDHILLSLAFVFSFIGDICIVSSTHFFQSNLIFSIGGISFCVMHVILIIRHGGDWKFLFDVYGKFSLKSTIFPLCFYIPSFAVFAAFAGPLASAGLLWIGLVYLLFVTTSFWVAWIPLKSGYYPKTNAWMMGLGLTSFFIMEAIGIIYNIKIGMISDIAFLFTWFFYVPFLLLLPGSGYKWEE